MNPPDKTLVKKLALALVIKLAVLTALWWGFVRDQRVAVDDKSVASQFMDRGAESPKERIK